MRLTGAANRRLGELFRRFCVPGAKGRHGIVVFHADAAVVMGTNLFFGFARFERRDRRGVVVKASKE